MTDSKEQDRKTLSLGNRSRLSLGGRPAEGAQVRQSFSHGRSKTVQVEHKRKLGVQVDPVTGRAGDKGGAPARGRGAVAGRALTQAERDARERAFRTALRDEEARRVGDVDVIEPVADEAMAEDVAEPVVLDAETLRRREMEELRRIEADEQRRTEEERRRLEEADRLRQEEDAKRRQAEKTEEEERRQVADRSARAAIAKVGGEAALEDADDRSRRPGVARVEPRRPPPARTKTEPRRRTGRMTVTQALSDESERTRSLASVRRQRERERRLGQMQSQEKVTRDVIIPETITVQELANRMAERGADVIKSLMRMGVMATINQAVDADTAELIVAEFGHRSRRVSASDVEIGLRGEADTSELLLPRPPVVTIMGHVDHGKTSLLDALRHTDVVSGEAGGITQHIGAYQVSIASGARITFIDTPGHAAFTSMRARGANITDIVVLVVAANDGVMPQTVEAIRHARAAKVPIIVAINKIDLPDARPERVRTELLQHEIVVEAMGGETLDVEVSAKTGQGLDRLEEAILLQAEVLDLRANPDRAAEGFVIEAKLERGRGAVATILVQRGTLHVGDIFVAGSQWGRVRALVNDRGDAMRQAGPAEPVEVLGFDGVPMAGDDFIVVDDEQRAREVTAFRDRRRRDAAHLATGRGSLEQMFSAIQTGVAKELPVVIKGDVQGSIEAIAASLEKLGADSNEVKVRVLHSAVGAINESDITLAAASRAMIIGFNVRANPQARELAKRDGVDIRYYSIIYNVIDDVRQMLSGMLAPTVREQFLGNAAIREVFNITKVGKVAGCMVTEGVVRRGARVRLLRDNVVIHEGVLKTLRRFKDEVREVREGYECGMAFENYENIQPGDVIEAFELEEVARAL